MTLGATVAAAFRASTVFGRRVVGLCCFVAAAVPGDLGGAAEYSEGAQLAASCTACHSVDGPDIGIPVIAGMDERAIIAAMRAYRASVVPSHIMHAVALSLTDEELARVAGYLAAIDAGEP